MTPRLSVIVPALVGYEAVRAVLAALEAQTMRHAIELVIVCPERGDWAVNHPGATIVEVGRLRLHRARAVGIRAARAPFVVLAEDHCIPDADWADALLGWVDDRWDAVGPLLRSGNPTTLVAQGSFLLGYGEWMAPLPSGPPRALPGHNVVVRREALLALGERLDAELLVCAILLQRLRARGGRLAIAPTATMRHYDSAGLATSVRIMFCVGSGFGAQRSAPWNPIARAAYALAAPALAALHWGRSVRQYRRAGRAAGLSPWCLAPAAAFAVTWAVGESVGALVGANRVEAWTSFGELNKMAYVRPQDRPLCPAPDPPPRRM